MKAKSLLVALAALCSVAAQANLVLDGFADSPPRSIWVSSLGTHTFDFAEASAIGGHRRVVVEATSMVGTGPHSGIAGAIGGGRSTWALDDGVVGNVTFTYGALAPLNLDLSWSLGFQFGFDFVDQPLDLGVTVWNGASSFTAPDVAVQPTFTRSEFLVSTSAFSGADWTSIDRVDIRLSGPASFDVVQAPLIAPPVPEPFTMTLGAAALALALRKRLSR